MRLGLPSSTLPVRVLPNRGQRCLRALRQRHRPFQLGDQPPRLDAHRHDLRHQPREVLRIVLAVRVAHDLAALVRADLVLCETESNESPTQVGHSDAGREQMQ